MFYMHFCLNGGDVYHRHLPEKQCFDSIETSLQTLHLPQNRIKNKCYKSKTTDFIKAVFHKSRYNLCIRVKLEKLGKYI